MGIFKNILSGVKGAMSNRPRSWKEVAKKLGIMSASTAGPPPEKPPKKKRGLLERIFGSDGEATVSAHREAAALKRLPHGSRGVGAVAPGDEEWRPWQEGIVLPEEDWRGIGEDEAKAFLEEGHPLFVQSSNVTMLQYHPADQILMIEYRNGRSYLYSNISRSDALSVLRALRKGVWVWDQLRGEIQRAAPNIAGLPGLKPYHRLR